MSLIRRFHRTQQKRHTRATHEIVGMVVAAEQLHREGLLWPAMCGYRAAILALGPAFLTHPAGRRAGFLLALGSYQMRIYDEAVSIMEAVRDAQWDDPIVHYNLGMLYGAARRPVDAAESYRIALALDPTMVAAENNLGNTLRELGDLDGSARCYERIMQRDPADAAARYNLAHVVLLHGDLARGFALYESRWQVAAWVAEYGRRDITSPRLVSGNPGCTVFVHQEQGLGDTLQCLRYLPYLVRLGYRVIFEAPRELGPWLRGIESYGLSVITKGAPIPAHDAHLPLLSIPAHLGIQSESDIPPRIDIPVRVPSPLWTAPGDMRRVVGFAWAGNAAHHADHHRTAPLEQLAALFALPHTRFVSLQILDRAVELYGALPRLPLGEGSEIVDVSSRLQDFETTAALVRACDAIVTVDTSMAHLGGVLGVPTFVLLNWLSEWRWQLERTDSPWYESVRLVRQPTLGDWPSTAHEAVRLIEAL